MVNGWIRAANGVAGVSGVRDPEREDCGIPSKNEGLAPALRKPSLAISGGELRRRHCGDSGGIEDVGFDLAFVALSWDFFAV